MNEVYERWAVINEPRNPERRKIRMKLKYCQDKNISWCQGTWWQGNQ